MFCETGGSSAANCSVAMRPASRAMRFQSSLSTSWRWSIACRSQPNACQPSGSNGAPQFVCELLGKTEQRDLEEETCICGRTRSTIDHVASDKVKHGAVGSARSHSLARGAMCPPGSTHDDAVRCARQTLPNARLFSSAFKVVITHTSTCHCICASLHIQLDRVAQP